jgi:4'-phosphopantetheinyl transferase
MHTGNALSRAVTGSWDPLPDPPSKLSFNAVDVWRAGLDPPEPALSQLRSNLASDELARADRFVFERDRRRYTAAHGILRAILGRYLGTDPAALVFQTEAAGKPKLAPARHGRSLQFNLSHSRDLALVAVTAGCDIGVDLEWVTDTVEVEQVASVVFSPAEIAVLGRLTLPQKREAFFTGWTRKEAIVKALGAGLGYPVQELTVSMAPDEPVRLIHADDAAIDSSLWTLEALFPAPGYVGAVAHRGARRTLRLLEWLPS